MYCAYRARSLVKRIGARMASSSGDYHERYVQLSTCDNRSLGKHTLSRAMGVCIYTSVPRSRDRRLYSERGAEGVAESVHLYEEAILHQGRTLAVTVPFCYSCKQGVVYPVRANVVEVTLHALEQFEGKRR